MPRVKRSTKETNSTSSLENKLNDFGFGSDGQEAELIHKGTSSSSSAENTSDALADDDLEEFYDSLFEKWEEKQTVGQDSLVDVPIDSLESAIGYSSLFRQMHQAFVRQVAFYRTAAGGSLTVEDARKRAFHSCTNKEEAKKHFRMLMQLPLESLNFIDLMELQEFAPRVGEWFWENAKLEARKEFESGHAAANITFPVGYMKQVWNIARYIGVRESFIDEWNPRGGIEVALIDMMAQSYFQWQFWLEQTVKRSQTKEQAEHPEYAKWKEHWQEENNWYGREEGYWFRPLVTEKDAIEHAVQMADRFNRMFMRTLRQLRDLRRYTQLTINNPRQVNIASEGGQQVNLADDHS